MTLRQFIACLLTWVYFVGCSDAQEDPRTAWLQSTLVEDNYPYALRSPDLVAGKFRKMAAGPYNFFRGTMLQFTRDMVERPGWFPTRFGTPEAAQVVVIGDPHYENVGTYRAADGALVLDFNDFDAASVGPFHLDVRRMALSAYIAMVQVEEWRYEQSIAQSTTYTPLTTEADRLDWSASVAFSYATEIGRLQQGGEPLRIRSKSGYGVIIDDIMRRALRDGEAREELSDYTLLLDDERRRFTLGDIEPGENGIIGDRLTEASAADIHWLREAWPELRNTLARPDSIPAAFLAIKDISQRFGAGVSSYPLQRFYVLVEGPTPDAGDDVLLEVKEAGNPTIIPGLKYYPYPRFASNAERVVFYQRELQETAGNDPFLGWLDGSGARSEDFGQVTKSSLGYRVRDRTKYQKGMDVSRLAEKLEASDWTLADFSVFVAVTGRLLASRHAVASVAGTLNDPLTTIHAAIDGRNDLFRDEARRFVAHYGPLVVEDYRRFSRLLDRHGPLLGIRSGLRTRDRL